MTLFPLIRGQSEIAATKVELYRYLREVCEEDLNMLYGNTTLWWGEKRHFEYGFEWYDNSFMAWKVPSGSLHKFIYTTLNVSFKETETGIQLSWHIRFNIWANLLFAVVTTGLIYTVYSVVLDINHRSTQNWLLGVLPFALFLLIFNLDAKGNLDLIEKIKERFSNTH